MKVAMATGIVMMIAVITMITMTMMVGCCASAYVNMFYVYLGVAVVIPA